MLFDILVLISFMCCFHERFSSISTPRNFVTFSLSMTKLPDFKKGSGSLKNLFFEAGWNREYVVFVKFSDNLFALNQRDILLSSQFISEKRSSMLCLKEINWYCQQAWLDLVFLSIYKDHLRKLRRAMGLRWIPGAHHIRCLGRQIFWCYYRRYRRCIDIGLRDILWTILSMYRLSHKALV